MFDRINCLVSDVSAFRVPLDLQEANLTDREQDTLACIVDGLSNKMIAHRLDISEGTVKVHVKNLLKKLNLRSRLEIAVWAFSRDMK